MSNKQDRLMRYLQEFGSITSLEAISELGDTRLSATIFDLRQKGINIVSTPVTNTNRWGEKVTYAEYQIVKGKRGVKRKCLFLSFVNTVKNIYGDVIDYNDFCKIIHDYGDDIYNSVNEHLTDYIAVWKKENNFEDVNTSVSNKFSIRSNDNKNSITVIITFSTVEKYMPKEWRLLDKQERQNIRTSIFNRRIKNYENAEYSEGTTLMGQCKWLISYTYKISVNNTDSMNIDEILPLLQNMNTELN